MSVGALPSLVISGQSHETAPPHLLSLLLMSQQKKHSALLHMPELLLLVPAGPQMQQGPPCYLKHSPVMLSSVPFHITAEYLWFVLKLSMNIKGQLHAHGKLPQHSPSTSLNYYYNKKFNTKNLSLSDPTCYSHDHVCISCCLQLLQPLFCPSETVSTGNIIYNDRCCSTPNSNTTPSPFHSTHNTHHSIQTSLVPAHHTTPPLLPIPGHTYL